MFFSLLFRDVDLDEFIDFFFHPPQCLFNSFQTRSCAGTTLFISSSILLLGFLTFI